MAGSLSFDPAAECYDRTRVTDGASLAPAAKPAVAEPSVG